MQAGNNTGKYVFLFAAFDRNAGVRLPPPSESGDSRKNTKKIQKNCNIFSFCRLYIQDGDSRKAIFLQFLSALLSAVLICGLPCVILL